MDRRSLLPPLEEVKGRGRGVRHGWTGEKGAREIFLSFFLLPMTKKLFLWIYTFQA